MVIKRFLVSAVVLIAFLAGAAWANPLQTPITWDAGGDGSSWSDPANWDPDGVPTAGDDVEITTNVTINLDVPAEVNNLTLTTATLEGSSDLTVGGLFTWSSGTIQGSGTVTADGGLVLDTGSTKTLRARTLELAGDADCSAGTLFLDDGAVVNNQAGQTFLITGTCALSADTGAGSPAFNNAGTVLRETSTLVNAEPAGPNGIQALLDGVNVFGTPLNNTGTLLIADGGLSFTAGTTFQPGSNLFLGTDATANFDGGTNDLFGTVDGIGGATGGTLGINGTATVSLRDGLNVGDITVDFNDGDLVVDTNTTLPEMTVSSNGVTTVNTGKKLSVSNGLRIDGFGSRIKGGGTVEAPFEINQVVTFEQATTVWKDGTNVNANVFYQSSATSQVPAGETATLNADLIRSGSVGNFAALNVDGVVQTTGDHKSNIQTVVGETGLFQVTTGTYDLTHTQVDGTIRADPGAVDRILGEEDHVFNDGANFQGDLTITRGTFTPNVQVNGNVTAENLFIDSGTVTINGTFDVEGNFVVERGFNTPTFSGGQDDRLNAPGVTTLSATTSSALSLDGLQVVFGDTTLAGGNISFANSAVLDGGIFNVTLTESDGGLVRSGTFNNNPFAQFYDVYFDLPNGRSFTSNNVPINVTHRAEFQNGQPALGVLNVDPNATLAVRSTDPPSAAFTAAQVNFDGSKLHTTFDGITTQPDDTFTVFTTDPNGVNGEFDEVDPEGLQAGQGLKPTYNDDNVQVVVTDGSAELSVTKEVLPDDEVDFGDTVTFYIVVTNAGPDAATNVRVIDNFDNGDFDIDRVSPSNLCEVNTDLGLTSVFCTFPTLAPGEAKAVSIDVVVRSDVKNTVDVDADQADPKPGNNEAIHFVFVNEPPAPEPVARPAFFEKASFQHPKLNSDGSKGPCADKICKDSDGDGIVDPVYFHSGEFYLEETDLRIPGRGFDYTFTRTYKNQIQYDGPLGFNWQHNYDYYLAQDGNNIVVVNGYARSDTYTSSDGVNFTAPAGFYTRLTRNPDDTYTLRNAYGREVHFNPLDGSPAAGKIIRLADRYGNEMTFHYDSVGRLDQVIDTLGRAIDYVYDANGRLDHIRDFFGRRARFAYNADGDLTMVTGPTVTGTPNGNDFPNSKTWLYTYSSGFADERLNHNLLTIIAPNEFADGSLTPRVVNTYGTDPAAYDFDRVVQQAWGGTNASGVPAGGTITLTYEELNPGGSPTDLTLPRNRTTVVDRNGNQKVYEHNVNGHRLSLKEFSNRDVRPSDPEFWETTYAYNADGERTRVVYSEGNTVEYDYDDANADRFQQGNLLSETRTPDPGRGGDQTTIQTTYTYEPIYNQVRAMTEPRGNDAGYVPQNGGTTSPERYTTTYTFDYEESCDFTAIGAKIDRTAAEVQQKLTNAGICTASLGDVNGDGITDQIDGNVIRTQHPTVNLLPGSNQAGIEGDTTQEIVTLEAFNTFGQIIYDIDPEGNVTDYIYFPETDPDGDGNPTPPPADGRTLDGTTGGYLRETRRDTREIVGPAIPERRNGPSCPTDFDGDGQTGIGDIQRLAGLWRKPVPTAIDQDGDGQIRISEIMALAAQFGQPQQCDSFVNIRNQRFYDPVGNIIREVDGRGIATDYVVNELNQIVQITRAATHDVFTPDPAELLPLTDFQYLARYFYDFNDNEVLEQVEDRGNTSNVDGNPPAPDLPPTAPDPDPVGGTAFVDVVYKYDILDNRIEMLQEVENGGSEFLRTRYRYDPNGNDAVEIQPEGNADAYVYDERDLPFQGTRGVLVPPPLALLAAGDPSDYDVRGGVPSTTTYHYDLNRNLIEAVDAADTDGSPDNNSDLGGAGDRTRYLYDGFDRRTSVVDSVGNQTVTQYDPAGNVVRVARFGPVGGPSPTSDGPDVLPGPVSSNGVIQAGNLVNANLLAATETLYDELSRAFQTDQVLFIASGVVTVRTPDVKDGHPVKGDLTPGDDAGIPGVAGVTILGRVSQRMEYDRKSRRTFVVEDDLDTYQTDYDGAGRVIRTEDSEGNVTRSAYDDNNNLIEAEERHVSQVPGVGNEYFLTTVFYDALNRVQRLVDNIGQTTYTRYDSRDNLVAEADAEGPLTGSTIERRAFAGGAATTNAINDFGNVTRHDYDGISRSARTERVLTATGQGDGNNIGADIFGVPSTIPPPDATQGGGDGLIQLRYDWDRNSLLTNMTDDDGNQMQSTYDNLDRRVTETRGVSTTPGLVDRVDPSTTISYIYDPDDNVTQLIDENGTITQCNFDAIQRTTSCAVQRAGTDILVGTVAFNPIIGTTQMTYEYDGLSRQVRITDNNDPAVADDDSVVTYVYDSLSRAVEDTQQIGPLPARTVDGAWRAGDLLTTVTYPNGRQIARSHDRMDRLTQIRDVVPPTTPEPIVEYKYIGRARVIQKRYQNGTILDYVTNSVGPQSTSYDGFGRTQRYQWLREADSSVIVAFDYDHKRTHHKRFEEKLHAPTESELYSYDSAYRMIGFQRGTLNSSKDAIVSPTPKTDVTQARAWNLDGVGNWASQDTTIAGGTASETRLTTSFNEHFDIDGAVQTHDDNGNLNDDGELVYHWDFRNELRRVTRKNDGAVIAEYTYDGIGRRIAKRVPAGSLPPERSQFEGTIHYTYLDNQVIEEYAFDGSTETLVQQYVYGIHTDEPLVLDRNLDGDESAIEISANGASPGEDQRLFYHNNNLYSIFGLTDESGNLVEAYEYDPYGQQYVFQAGGNGTVDFQASTVVPGGVSAFNNHYLYTGRQLDEETGLYHYRHRFFDSERGRFLSRDPLQPDDFHSLYAYVVNNPTNFIDPLGLKCEGREFGCTELEVGRKFNKIARGFDRLFTYLKLKKEKQDGTNNTQSSIAGSFEVCPKCCKEGTNRPCGFVTDYKVKVTVGGFHVSAESPGIPVWGFIKAKAKLELYGKGEASVSTDKCECAVMGGGCMKIGGSLGLKPYADAVVLKGGVEGTGKVECKACLAVGGSCRGPRVVFKGGCCLSAELSLWAEVDIKVYKDTYKWKIYKTPSFCPSWLKWNMTLLG